MENTEQQSQKSATGQMTSSPRSLHTPGPWTLFDDRIAAPCYEHRNCEKTIAWLRSGGVLQCTHNNDGSLLSNNARLIAAAPELLEACRALPFAAFEDEENIDAAQFVDECNSFLTAMRLARAAIAKAEGAPSVQERNEVL